MSKDNGEKNKSDGKKKAVQLPLGLHELVVEKAHRLLGNKYGLVRHVWTVAACMVLETDDETMKQAARSVRDHFEDGGDIETARVIVGHILRNQQTSVKQVAVAAAKKPKPPQRRKAT